MKLNQLDLRTSLLKYVPTVILFTQERKEQLRLKVELKGSEENIKKISSNCDMKKRFRAETLVIGAKM